MFSVDDVVVYGKNGVCKVTQVGTLNLPMIDPGKQYYTMHPLYKKDAVLYAPVDNNKSVLRRVMSKEEAQSLLDEIPMLEGTWIVSEKDRENQYKSALAACDCRQLVKIIKALQIRKQSRLQDGKKVTVVDERYSRLAGDQLFEELTYALGLTREEFDSFFY